MCRDEHCNEPVDDISQPSDHKQDAEDFRHETGSVREVADQQQMNPEDDQANEPDRAVRVNCAQRLVWIVQEPECDHELNDGHQVDGRKATRNHAAVIERLRFTGWNSLSSAAATMMSSIATRIRLAVPHRNSASELEMSIAVFAASPGVTRGWMATKLPKAARTAINASASPAIRLAVRSDRVT